MPISLGCYVCKHTRPLFARIHPKWRDPPIALQRFAGFRHRTALARSVGIGWHLRGPESRRTFSRPRKGCRASKTFRTGHVPVSKWCRLTRRSPTRLHRHRCLRSIQAHDWLQRASRVGLRQLRLAGRTTRHRDWCSPTGQHRSQCCQHASSIASTRTWP